ncbi:MAG: spore coat U domain-containing protein [Candidatus Aquilonibacter sp.]|jgi:spore coat protein U-like protein
MGVPAFCATARAQEPQVAVPPGATCSITANPMSFSIYDPTLPYDDSAVGTVGILCNVPLVLQISLITNDSCNQRYLRSGANRLAYNLYQDSGHNIVWGSLNPICGQVRYTAAVFQAQFPIYGNIPRLQSVGAGTYSDIVTIQVNF